MLAFYTLAWDVSKSFFKNSWRWVYLRWGLFKGVGVLQRRAAESKEGLWDLGQVQSWVLG